MVGTDSQKIVALLKKQIADLKAQLELSNQRETALIDERSKRLDFLPAEKEEKRTLTPPVDGKNPNTPNYLFRLLGARYPFPALLLYPSLGPMIEYPQGSA